MRLMIYLGDEGPTDLDFKDGDVWAVQPNSWTPGALEAKKWLIIEMEEYGGEQTELVQPEYSVGVPEPVQRHARKYYVPYWIKAGDPGELAMWRDKDATKPIITGRFNVFDIVRK